MALRKGLVGLRRESGIKILRKCVDGFTRELRTGSSGQRLFGRIDDNSVLAFERFVRGRALCKLTDEMVHHRTVPELQTLRKTLLRWRHEICNYFRFRITDGATKGFNNKES